MRQLALDLKLADYARFDCYFPGPNQVVVDALKHVAMCEGTEVNWVWGAPGSGRSHLLQATLAAAAVDRCGWIPLQDVNAGASKANLVPGVLEGMGSMQLLCIDDIDVVAGDADWERALFNLFEALRGRRAQLVVSASQSPTNVPFNLRDLASRLASGPTWKLQPLTDEDRKNALKLRAKWHGLKLPEETAEFLLRRVARDNAKLFMLLEKLDGAALAAQRRLTIPFVKEVLEL